MKRKMNIGAIDTSLSRSEMREIMAGSGGGGVGPGDGCSSCSCNYQGCQVSFTQCSTGWYMVTCAGTSTGSGTYHGTVCGGQCP